MMPSGNPISSYPKIHNLGHPEIAEIFMEPVQIEEKVDGSQFSFTVNASGEVLCRSKNNMIEGDGDKMFKAGVESAREIAANATPGWVYCCEYLGKPKHNVLAYERIPENHLMLFDVRLVGEAQYAGHEMRTEEAEKLGLETPPVLYVGMVRDLQELETFLELDSFLGGQKLEGIVIKQYGMFGRDDKPLMAKVVRQEFRELHGQEWKKNNPAAKDIKGQLGDWVHSEARWIKAIQRRAEAGELIDGPQDIGPLIEMIKDDIEVEEIDRIKERLYDWAKRDILRGAIRGFPEWYKARLLEQQQFGASDAQE